MEEPKNNERPERIERGLETKKETTAQKKKRFLASFQKRMTNVAKTCEVVGITRATYYRWMEDDEKFKKAVEEARESFYDDLETTMFTRGLVDKSDTMLIWLSKTKMRQRGYVEKIESDVTVNPFLQLMQQASADEPEGN